MRTPNPSGAGNSCAYRSVVTMTIGTIHGLNTHGPVFIKWSEPDIAGSTTLSAGGISVTCCGPTISPSGGTFSKPGYTTNLSLRMPMRKSSDDRRFIHAILSWNPANNTKSVNHRCRPSGQRRHSNELTIKTSKTEL